MESWERITQRDVSYELMNYLVIDYFVIISLLFSFIYMFFMFFCVAWGLEIAICIAAYLSNQPELLSTQTMITVAIIHFSVPIVPPILFNLAKAVYKFVKPAHIEYKLETHNYSIVERWICLRDRKIIQTSKRREVQPGEIPPTLIKLKEAQ